MVELKYVGNNFKIDCGIVWFFYAGSAISPTFPMGSFFHLFLKVTHPRSKYRSDPHGPSHGTAMNTLSCFP